MGGSCPVGDRPLFSVLHRAGPWKVLLTGHSQRRCKATCLLPHSPPQRAKAGIPQIPGRLRGRGNGYVSTIPPATHCWVTQERSACVNLRFSTVKQR